MIRSLGTISPQCQLVSSVEDLTLINNIASHNINGNILQCLAQGV